MSRIVVFGQGPMRWESSTRLFALALRTWHFANTLASQGHDVLLFAIRGHAFEGWPHEKVSHVRRGRVSVWSLSEHLAHERPELILRKMEEHAPEAVVGVNRDPAAIAVNYAGQLPFWADVNGDPMAEAQVKASALGADWNINEWYRTLMPVLLRADRFSTCSMAQRHALIGQLGMVGRLSAKNDGYEFVSAVPNSIDDEELELLGRLPRTPRAPGDRFVVLWSGGYNTWTAPDVLFDALQIAMDEAPELHFVSTGGGIAGHHEDAYERFRNAVRRSRHKKRFELAGWVQTAELPAFYAGAHAAILVDRFSYEGTLGARTRMLDWLAAGLPIVTTRLSEISHEVERAGAAITAACGDARGLADAMLELLRDPAGAARRGELGRQWAHDVCRAELQLEALARWARAPSRAPDGERRVRLDHRPNLVTSTRKQASLVRTELARGGVGGLVEKVGELGVRKLKHGAERFADRLGLAEGMHAQTTPLGPDAPALEAPRLARFQWRQRLERAAPLPRVAIALLVDRSTEPHVLDWTLAQFELQYFENWELVVGVVEDLGDVGSRVLDQAIQRVGQRRVDLVRIDGSDLDQHRALRAADYVLFLTGGCLLRPDALAELVTLARERSADVVYGKERYVDASGVPLPAKEKPEFASDLLICRPFLGPAVLYSSRAFAIDTSRAARTGLEALGYDVALRSTERAERIAYLPHVVCQVWQSPANELERVEASRRARAAELEAAEAALLRRGLRARLEHAATPGTFRLRYPVPEGTVQVVVPESTPARGVERALASLRRHTKRSNVTIGVLPAEAPLPRAADYLVIVDRSVEALHDGWLECLLEELAFPGAVAVSPKLVSPRGGSVYTGGTAAAHELDLADASRETTSLHPACVALSTRELEGELPRDLRARSGALAEATERWQKLGRSVRYTPHTAFCIHHELEPGETRPRTGA